MALPFSLPILAGGTMKKDTPMMEMTRRYGHTVYRISAYGSPDAANTYEDRLLHLIRHESEKMDSSKEPNHPEIQTNQK